MPYLHELDSVTYINSGDGWSNKKTGEKPSAIIEEELNKILDGKLQAKEEKITDAGELLQLAAKYSRQGFLDRALKLCDRIVALSPDNEMGATTVISSVLRKKGESEKAIKITDRFSKNNNPALLTTRAAAFCDIEDWVSAKSTIARALAILKGVSQKGEAFSVVRRIKSARPDLYKND